jgi:hypothetical protein
MSVSVDGSTAVEWEISEWIDDGSNPEPSSKRKLGEVGEGNEKDVHMRDN